MKRWGLTFAGALALALAFLVPTLVSGVAHAGGATPMPAALMFPMTGTGSQSKSMSVQFVNTSNAQITIDSVVVGGANPNDFVIVNPPGLPIGLVPGAGLPVDVAFAPTVGGARSGQLQAQVRGEMATTNASLSGTGVGPKITVTPSPLVAGGLLFGQMVPPLAASVSNAGGAPVTVKAMSIVGPDAARFSLTGLPALPATLQAAQQFAFNLTFSPAQAGAAMASLVVDSTDPMTPQLTTVITGYSGNPKITLDLGTVIFGNQRVGQPTGGQDIMVSNTGLSDLHISDIKFAGANPGDFSFSAKPAVPATLKVGASTRLTVLFTPGAAGPRSGTIQVLSDDPVTPTRTVSMSGVGTTPGAMVSPAMIDFGAVKVNAVGNASITLKNSGNGPVLVKTLDIVGNDAASFTASLMAPFTIQGGATTVVQIAFKPKKVANFTASVNITTDDPNVLMASVMLKGSSTSPMFSVSPMSLDFGGFVVGTSSPPKSFTIKNTGNQAMQVTTFAIAGFNSSSFTMAPLMKPPFSVPIGQSLTFMVTYKASIADFEDAQVNIGTDDPLNPSATVKLSGQGQQPNLKTVPLDMDVFDFGKVPVGSTSKPNFLKMENTGDAPLSIKSVKVMGMMGGFAVDMPGPFMIDVKSSVTLKVTFTPLMGDMYTGTLEVTPGHDFIQPVTINLIGEGLATMITATAENGTGAIDFGPIPLNTPSPASVMRIHNGSKTTSQAVSVKVDQPQFTLDAPFVTVPPDGTVSMNIRFTPDAAKVFTGTVSVSVQGATMPLASVSVKGEGVDEGAMNPTMRDTGCNVGGRSPFGALLLLALVLGVAATRRRRVA